MESVVLKRSGPIATIYFNEINTLNALSQSLKMNLLKTLRTLEDDLTVRVIILTGNGRAFCAGGDVKNMANESYDPSHIKRNLEISTTIIQLLRSMKKIIISAIHGPVAGAGISLALASDIIVAEEKTKLILAFKNVGLSPDLGIHYHLPKIVGEWKAKQWIWQGKNISVEEAVEQGFTIDIVPRGSHVTRALEIAHNLDEGPFQAFMYSKEMINQAESLTLDEVLMRENNAHIILRSTVNHKEGIEAFLEKKKVYFSQ